MISKRIESNVILLLAMIAIMYSVFVVTKKYFYYESVKDDINIEGNRKSLRHFDSLVGGNLYEYHGDQINLYWYMLKYGSQEQLGHSDNQKYFAEKFEKFEFDEKYKLQYARYLSEILKNYAGSDSILYNSRFYNLKFEPLLGQLASNAISRGDFRNGLKFIREIERDSRGVIGLIEEKLFRLAYVKEHLKDTLELRSIINDPQVEIDNLVKGISIVMDRNSEFEQVTEIQMYFNFNNVNDRIDKFFNRRLSETDFESYILNCFRRLRVYHYGVLKEYIGSDFDEKFWVKTIDEVTFISKKMIILKRLINDDYGGDEFGLRKFWMNKVEENMTQEQFIKYMDYEYNMFYYWK